MADFYVAISNCLPCCNVRAFLPTIECRTIGGIAALCGSPAFVSPSTPPNTYLKRTVVGDRCAQGWASPPGVCSGDCGNVSRNVTSGNCTTSNVNCVQTNNLSLLTKTQIQIDCDCTALSLAAGAQPICNYTPTGGAANTSSSVGVGNYLDAVSSTVWSRTYLGNCEDLGTSVRITTGNESITLSDLDSEANAITRLKSNVNYTAWTNVGDGTGGTCLKTNCCQSVYESRSNTLFAYTESQYRCNVFGLSNSTAYTLVIEAWRSLHGAANYALYAYAFTSFTSNATGFGSVIGNVPITLGYDTYVTNPDVY